MRECVCAWSDVSMLTNCDSLIADFEKLRSSLSQPNINSHGVSCEKKLESISSLDCLPAFSVSSSSCSSCSCSSSMKDSIHELKLDAKAAGTSDISSLLTSPGSSSLPLCGSYVVLRILASRRKNMKQQYLLALQGEKDMWFDASMLTNCDSLISDFAKLQSSPAYSISDNADTKSTAQIQNLGELPVFPPMSLPIFKWGSRDAADFISDVQVAYGVVTKWRKNVFKLPSGTAGKKFTQALTRLYLAWAECSPLESIALKAAAIMVPLLLQQPMGKGNHRANTDHLLRRLALWDDGCIAELLKEGSTIQKQLNVSRKSLDDSSLAKRFATMVFNNNLKRCDVIVVRESEGLSSACERFDCE